MTPHELTALSPDERIALYAAVILEVLQTDAQGLLGVPDESITTA